MVVFLLSLLSFVTAIQQLPINAKSNSFGDFALGAGFDINRYEPLSQHVFNEFFDNDAENGIFGVTYDFMPVTRTKTKCGIIASAKDVSEKLGISGEVSIETTTISGSGFLEFDQSTEKMRKKTYYTCIIDRGLFTISVNPPRIPHDASLAERAEVLPEYLLDTEMTQDEFIKEVGDYHVRSITYGRRYKTEVMMSYSNDQSYETMIGQLEASYGVAGLAISAEINYENHESSEQTDMWMTVSSESYGFIPPKTLFFPTTNENGIANSNAAFAQVQDDIAENLAAMDGKDNDQSNPITLQGAQTGLTRAEVFALIGDAYPISYTIAKNKPFYPEVLTALTAMQEIEMVHNIDEAYDILRELKNMDKDIVHRAEQLFENYHLLSDESDMSIPFLQIRQDLSDEIAALSREVKAYLGLYPINIAEQTIYEWAASPLDPKALTHTSLDILRSKVWRIIGMEDAPMDINENAIGATCIFNGIQGDYAEDGANTDEVSRLKFAGRVVFADTVVRHIVFNLAQEIVSLGFIDHDNDCLNSSDDNCESTWPEYNEHCDLGSNPDPQGHHELVLIKNDCTMFRYGTPVWYENVRYVICAIGSADSLTKSGYVNKEELTNIRLSLVPIDSNQDITIVITENESENLHSRGRETSLTLQLDEDDRLMYKNGYICDAGFGINEAKMVCSALGYSRMEKFETHAVLPTANAWERPVIKLHSLACPKYAMVLGQCDFSEDDSAVNWNLCGKDHGVQLVCSDSIPLADEVQVDISSSNHEGCVFNSQELDAGMIETNEHCVGGPEHPDDFGFVTEVSITGEVCVTFVSDDKLQCAFTQGVFPFASCGVMETIQNSDDLLLHSWSLSEDLETSNDGECVSFLGWSGTGSLTKELHGNGDATLVFGNCGATEIGTVSVELNNHVVAIAEALEQSQFITFTFEDGDVLKITNDDDGIIQVASFETFVPCEYSSSMFDYVGNGFCRSCEGEGSQCGVNGFKKANSNLAECQAACLSADGCVGIGFGDSDWFDQTNVCFIHGPESMTAPDEDGWETYAKTNYVITQTSGVVDGSECYIFNPEAQEQQAYYGHNHCYSDYHPNEFPQEVEIKADYVTQADVNEADEPTEVRRLLQIAEESELMIPLTYAITAEMVDWSPSGLPIPTALLKVEIDGETHIISLNEIGTSESNMISGARCGQKFHVEIEVQGSAECKFVGDRPVYSQNLAGTIGSGIVGGDVHIQITCYAVANVNADVPEFNEYEGHCSSDSGSLYFHKWANQVMFPHTTWEYGKTEEECQASCDAYGSMCQAYTLVSPSFYEAGTNNFGAPCRLHFTEQVTPFDGYVEHDPSNDNFGPVVVSPNGSWKCFVRNEYDLNMN